MRLAQVARDNPDELFVNSIYFKTPPGRLSCHDIGMGDKGGFQAQNCSMAFEELCRCAPLNLGLYDCSPYRGLHVNLGL
jgi:hypothetical protein